MAAQGRSPSTKDILARLPAGISEYRYQGRQQLEKIMEEERCLFDADESRSKSEYVAFSHIDKQTFHEDISSKDDPFDSYYLQVHLLVIKMPSRSHGKSYGALTTKMIAELSKMMEVDKHLSVEPAVEVVTSTRTKVPDYQFRPEVLPAGRSDQWPSMVIEAGYSQSKTSLQDDAKWWLKESCGDVKIVLTISTDKTNQMVYEIWQPRGRVPMRAQRVVVTHKDDEIVASGSLTIPFKDLFLRDAKQGEYDIVVDAGDLQEWARNIWKEHDVQR